MTAVLGVSSDAELVELAKAGDRDAFRHLFDRHAHRVMAACRKKTRSSADVEDAVQEAFVRALANLDQLRNPEQFGAWVRSIAIRACLDQHRRTKRVIAVEDDWQIDRADTAPLPDELAERRERDAALWASMDRLGERDRTALYLRHIAEAPVAAVASELGMTEGSTRVMLVRARERLRLVASGLAGLLPLPWRRWIRDHVHAAAPAIEAIAIVVAVGVTAGVVGLPDEAPAKGQVQTPVVERRERAEDRPAKREAKRAAQPRAERQAPADAAVEAGSTPARAQSGGSDDRDEARRIPLPVVKDTVSVRRDYPGEEETQELVDVTVFSEEQESTTRLYGNNVNDTTQPVAADVKKLIGLDE